jgi:hypothetical protein
MSNSYLEHNRWANNDNQIFNIVYGNNHLEPTKILFENMICSNVDKKIFVKTMKLIE